MPDPTLLHPINTLLLGKEREEEGWLYLQQVLCAFTVIVNLVSGYCWVFFKFGYCSSGICSFWIYLNQSNFRPNFLGNKESISDLIHTIRTQE